MTVSIKSVLYFYYYQQQQPQEEQSVSQEMQKKKGKGMCMCLWKQDNLAICITHCSDIQISSFYICYSEHIITSNPFPDPS